jgi:hypothetical protein
MYIWEAEVELSHRWWALSWSFHALYMVLEPLSHSSVGTKASGTLFLVPDTRRVREGTYPRSCRLSPFCVDSPMIMIRIYPWMRKDKVLILLSKDLLC